MRWKHSLCWGDEIDPKDIYSKQKQTHGRSHCADIALNFWLGGARSLNAHRRWQPQLIREHDELDPYALHLRRIV